MTPAVAGPRGSGRDLPAWWAPEPTPAEPRGAARLRAALGEQPSAVRGGGGGALGHASGASPGPAVRPPAEPWAGLREAEGPPARCPLPKELTVPACCAVRSPIG